MIYITKNILYFKFCDTHHALFFFIKILFEVRHIFEIKNFRFFVQYAIFLFEISSTLLRIKLWFLHRQNYAYKTSVVFSNMVMPNIGAFIAWGFITALFIPDRLAAKRNIRVNLLVQ